MSSRRSARPPAAPLALAFAALTLVVAVLAPPALAQTEPTTTTSSSTSTTVAATTTTTARPATTTTTTAAPITTTSTTAPLPPDPSPVEPTTPTTPTTAPTPTSPPAPTPVDPKAEDSSDEPPPPRVAVPSRTTPRVLTPVDQAVARVLEEQLKLAQQAAGQALLASQAADQALAAVEAEQAALQRSFETLHADEAAAAERLIVQRQQMRTRAVAIYVSGPGEPIIPAGDDIEEYGRRRVLVQALHAADKRSLAGYLEAKASAGSEVDGIVDRLEELNGRVLAARADSEAKAAATQTGLRSVAPAQAGGRLAINGFAFPVAEPHSFVSTFGAPRSGGRLHQGNDIFAPYGTPLYAAERGIVGKMGTNSLGGIKLWVTGESGTSYYYAHLSAFALNVNDGTVVEAGDVVGFVGNTGNAITTPPHLHFEIHPFDGPAIDPYPVLKAASDATRKVAAAQPPAPPVPADTTPTLPTPTLPTPAAAAP